MHDWATNKAEVDSWLDHDGLNLNVFRASKQIADVSMSLGGLGCVENSDRIASQMIVVKGLRSSLYTDPLHHFWRTLHQNRVILSEILFLSF